MSLTRPPETDAAGCRPYSDVPFGVRCHYPVRASILRRVKLADPCAEVYFSLVFKRWVVCSELNLPQQTMAILLKNFTKTTSPMLLEIWVIKLTLLIF